MKRLERQAFLRKKSRPVYFSPLNFHPPGTHVKALISGSSLTYILGHLDTSPDASSILLQWTSALSEQENTIVPYIVGLQTDEHVDEVPHAEFAT